jgi:hypothetical protein
LRCRHPPKAPGGIASVTNLTFADLLRHAHAIGEPVADNLKPSQRLC